MKKFTNNRGFLLLWVLAGIVVMGAAAGMMMPMVHSMWEDYRFNKEREALKEMKNEMQGSFFRTNELENVGIVAAEYGGQASTIFTDPSAVASTMYQSTATLTSDSEWLGKIARTRGEYYSLGLPYASNGAGDIASIAFNSYKLRRVVLVGPTNEKQQRYLIVSLMAPPTRGLAFPTNPTLFDEIWNNRWDGNDSQPPVTWSTQLPAAGIGSYGQWGETGSGGRTNAARILVERVVQRKYTIIVNNNHPTDTLWVDIGYMQNAIVAAPNSGTSTSAAIPVFATGIPEGRMIRTRRGLNAATAAQVGQFPLTDDATLWVQVNN